MHLVDLLDFRILLLSILMLFLILLLSILMLEPLSHLHGRLAKLLHLECSCGLFLFLILFIFIFIGNERHLSVDTKIEHFCIAIIDHRPIQRDMIDNTISDLLLLLKILFDYLHDHISVTVLVEVFILLLQFVKKCIFFTFLLLMNGPRLEVGVLIPNLRNVFGLLVESLLLSFHPIFLLQLLRVHVGLLLADEL